MSDMHTTTARMPATDAPAAGERTADERAGHDDAFTLRIPKLRGGLRRAALRTTEFWMTLGLVFLVLLATYLDEDSLSREDGWRFATFAVVAYIVSRGLAKFGNHADGDADEGSARRRAREIDVR